MDENSKKTDSSSFPGSLPANEHLKRSKLSDVEVEQELEAALAAGDNARALEVLDAAPRWMKRQPGSLLVRAILLLSQGDEQQGLRLLLEIERKHPKFAAVYMPLTLYYMDQGWMALALQAAKRAQSDRDLDDEGRASLEQVIETATASIEYLARELALPFDTMQRACIFNERAQIALNESKLSEAAHLCREAIKLAPNWNPPHNNRAKALYFSGKVGEAISVSQAVLARDAENIFALSSLVTYHTGLDQPEPALDYAHRLGQLFKTIPPDGFEIENVISALALVEDTPTLWKIAKGYLNAPADSLYARSWFCLAVAAVRSGKWKDALKLMEKPDEEELPPAGVVLLEELRATANQRHPRLAWMPPAYPGVDLFYNGKVIAEWGVLLEKLDTPLSPSLKRKLNNFFQIYPFMFNAMKRLLWDSEGNPAGMQILVDMDRPDADAEILRFAFSQTGSQTARLQALMKLVQLGRYTGPKIVELWNEDLEEWRDVEVNTQQIGDITPNARPETMALIEKARDAKDPAESISILRKAVEMEPASPIAVFNLGVMLVQNGEVEEGKALLARSVEVDPNYAYGHASIALSAAVEGREQEALDHLRVVTRTEVITPDTAVVANLAWFLLSLEKQDVKAARQRFEMAVQINPDHKLIKPYEKMLQEAEDYNEKFGFLVEYRRKSTQRAHQKLLKSPLSAKMDLHACLETHTKDMLVGSAHFLKTSSSGKKGELVSRLAQSILDPDFLQETVDVDLTKKEREALQWMLEADGVRPWKEFARKYGDGAEESTAWNYLQPETIPGRLRLSGLFYSGILDGQTVAFIPVDVRPLLRKLL